MKNNEQRINNIIGQMQGIKNMLRAKQDCVAVIIQLKAVKSAMSSLSAKVIGENVESCMKGLDKKGREKISKLINELTKIE